MSDVTYSIRGYAHDDFELLTGWWLAHDGQRRLESILPRCGVICSINDKPAAALFLHMDNSCGMCLVEHAVSRPGLSLKKARAAFGHCVACLKKIAGVHGYHTMAAFVPAAIARTLENIGFMRAEENLVQMVGFIEPEVPNG